MSMINGKRRILVVCGGNTCRSPMAKIILEQMLEEEGLRWQFEVDSAAYRGPDGTSAHPHARKTIEKRYGADLLARHVPKKLTDGMAEQSDLIIVMENYMKGGLPAKKVIVLDIPDPFGPSQAKYDECAHLIEQQLKRFWRDIVGPTELPPKVEALPGKIGSPQTASPGTASVCHDVIEVAKKVEYGRKDHPQTVTRLMRNMYDDMVAIGFINGSADKRKLAEAAGLSHDIGVPAEERGEGPHHITGFKMLEEGLWQQGLSPDRKEALAVVMYAVFYHREHIPNGKLQPLKGILRPVNDIPLHDYRTTAELVSLLRVADGLDYGLVTGSPDRFEKVEMARTSKGAECRLFPRAGKDVTAVVTRALTKGEVFEATFGKLTFWLPGKNGEWIPFSRQR